MIPENSNQPTPFPHWRFRTKPSHPSESPNVRCENFKPDVALFAQIKGIVEIGTFTFLSSLAVWAILKYTVGIRVSEEEEYNGMDVSEFGLHSYPEFVERQGV